MCRMATPKGSLGNSTLSLTTDVCIGVCKAELQPCILGMEFSLESGIWCQLYLMPAKVHRAQEVQRHDAINAVHSCINCKSVNSNAM